MISSLNQVCRQCRGLFEHAAHLLTSESEDGNISDDVAIEFTEEHHSLLIANNNAKSCHMCSLIAHVFPHILNAYDPHSPIQWVMWGDKDDQLLDLGFQIRKYDFIQDLRIQISAKAAVSLHHTPITWSFEALQTVQVWMQNCASTTTTHRQCERPTIKRQLPLRLVDVMPDRPPQIHSDGGLTRNEFQALDIDIAPPVRIISTKSLPLDIRYMTLSHRWGNSPSIILNSTTVSTLLNSNIPSEQLESSNAKLFRHAMYVTRCLGIRYLWIDSMCIMQDDDSEKAKEIALMGEIYYNSSLNISATDSTSGADGLIFNRDVLKTSPCQLSVQLPGVNETLDLIAFHNKILVESDEDIRPEGEPIDPTSAGDMRGILSASYSAALPDDTMNALWYDVVRQYSATSLSFSGDRLLAVSALAERYSILSLQSPDEYVAGIWMAHLPLALVWRRIPRTEAPSMSLQNMDQEQIAPTWSWAALTCAVESADMDYLHPNIAVVELGGIQRRSASPFDGVTSCWLRVRGHMCKVEQGAETASIEMVWDKPAADDGGCASRLFLLYVAYRSFKSRRDMRGLVLQRTNKRGQYIRLGAFSTSNFDIEGTYIGEAFTGNTHNLEEEDFLEFTKSQGYTVEII
ncbi:heterokaryon incompatibility protein (HET) domain-containing protein [Trichoderma breve]|uniref:Heterokaryon incompatibility protein (HET) domain-containing protein n=1 Tax=Trichoderma breve TaxID=2034170 RepID=A0A9W9EEP6_9HYPO|nr:heterokaryon incompatibility protein (HET) domain-containing protein [Trichoderma breve]KAJ4865330.1 heterokaryon incompatibility protein (HET) domain-containing protein [Trichoderma breve]